MNLVKAFRAARRVSTPLVAITTADPAATIQVLQGAVENGADPKAAPPILRWDIVNGMRPLNDTGEVALLRLVGIDPETFTAGSAEQMEGFQQAVQAQTGNPTESLRAALRLPGGSVLFWMNAHLYLQAEVPNSQSVRQAVWNLRDPYKGDQRMLVLLAPAVTFPPELASDIIALEEPLPDDEALTGIVTEQLKGVGLKVAGGIVGKAVDALRGLSAFTAEQVTAMSLTSKTGLDLEALWERKRQAVEQTPGLSVDRGKETFEDMGGYEQIKKFCSGLFQGGSPPKVIVRLDEIEKQMSASGGVGPGDTSGVAQDQLGVLLREMEDQDWTGFIQVSPPGCGKTLLSKALSNTFAVPSVALDLGAAKGSFVGESEAKIRAAIRVVKAMAGRSGACFVATCNGIAQLKPELRRRFRLGIWYLDLPSQKEREAIWAINLKRYKLDGKQPLPEDKGWTGADIRNACDVAWRLGCSLQTAALYLVPVVKSDPEGIDKLRASAQGRFLSANYPGPYLGADGPSAAAVVPGKPGGRKVSLREEG